MSRAPGTRPSRSSWPALSPFPCPDTGWSAAWGHPSSTAKATYRRLDGRLILGAVLFGVGWGLVGFCPGPALAALGTGDGKAVGFLAAMTAGMWLYGRIARR